MCMDGQFDYGVFSLLFLLVTLLQLHETSSRESAFWWPRYEPLFLAVSKGHFWEGPSAERCAGKPVVGISPTPVLLLLCLARGFAISCENPSITASAALCCFSLNSAKNRQHEGMGTSVLS